MAGLSPTAAIRAIVSELPGSTLSGHPVVPPKSSTAGDPVTESMSNQVHRTTADRLNNASDVTGQIVQGRAVERTATAPDATHINRDRLEPSANQRVPQMIKIAGATARIREQH